MFGHDDNHKPNDNGQDGNSDNTVKTGPADDGWRHPDLTSDAADDNDQSANNVKPASKDGQDEPATATSHPETSNVDIPSSHPNGDELIDLKQQALTKLSPLVDQLDQSPSEKFRTLMMMIQASDNQRLVRQAYDVALKIDDEKERAQALLDIVNEINYFTQNGSSSSAD